MIHAKDDRRLTGDHGHMKNAFRLLGACAIAGSFSVPAFAADPDNGLNLARHWCAACHVVSPDQKEASADVPTFADIARRTTDTKPLALFLTKPHGQMPDMTLSQPEIADIIAYIMALGPNPPPPAPKTEAPGNGLSGAIKPSR